VAFTVAITDRIPGPTLTSTDQPVALVVAPQAGQDAIQLTWVLPTSADGELVELSLTGDLGDGGLSIIGLTTIDWGDGSPVTTLSSPGRSFNTKIQHNYTVTTPVTITTEIAFTNNDIVLEFTTDLTPVPTTDAQVDQIQIEKLEDDVLRYAPDWRSVDTVPVSFTDTDVQRGFHYRYRYRLRKVDSLGEPTVTSAYSVTSTTGPWA
jgi:hypothetical protein